MSTAFIHPIPDNEPCPRRNPFHRTFLARLLLIAGIAMAPGPLAANDSRPAGAIHDGNAIQVFADRLIADNTEHYVEFRGNVRAVQGDTVITSDTLKLYYQNRHSPDNASRFSEQNISRVIARGNVRIRFEDRDAQTDQAEYDLEEGALVLTGEQSRVSSGADYIVGRRIVLQRAANSIVVEGTEEQPVEALFHGVGSHTAPD